MCVCVCPVFLCQRGDREAEIKGALHEAPSWGEDRPGQGRPGQIGHYQETEGGSRQEERRTQERWEDGQQQLTPQIAPLSYTKARSFQHALWNSKPDTISLFLLEKDAEEAKGKR